MIPDKHALGLYRDNLTWFQQLTPLFPSRNRSVDVFHIVPVTGGELPGGDLGLHLTIDW